MTGGVHPVIRRYAAGELSAERAADALGPGVSVSEVIAMLREAGLPPPEPPAAQGATELARARLLLGVAVRGAADEGRQARPE